MKRIDDLQINGLKLIQDDELFCFGCDSVELANFAGGARGKRACDLGAGTGIITVLLAGKYAKTVTAVEIQAKCAQLIRENAELNNLQEQITVLNMPMQELKGKNLGRFDIVVCNPPYRKVGSGEMQACDAVSIARHEVAVTLHEVIECAAGLLSSGGKFFIIHEGLRLAEVIAECTANRLEPKVLQILRPSDSKKPHIFMLECIFGGKVGLKILSERNVQI